LLKDERQRQLEPMVSDPLLRVTQSACAARRSSDGLFPSFLRAGTTH
jgi:hypothetical protein